MSIALDVGLVNVLTRSCDDSFHVDHAAGLPYVTEKVSWPVSFSSLRVELLAKSSFIDIDQL